MINFPCVTRLALRLFILLLHLLVTEGVAQSQTEESVRDQFIKTVRLYPLLDEIGQESQPAAVPLSGDVPLILEFDHLYAEYTSFYVKLVHCNADWSPSRLFPLDYLDVYNEFPVEDYAFSFNTRVPYVHYRFVVPPVKVPGNYQLIVYHGNEEEVILTKRFVVFDNLLILDRNSEFSGMGRLTRMTQEIQFAVKYPTTAIDDPQRNIKATIRQNQRWSSAIESLAPSNVRYQDRLIEFLHFGQQTQFRGGNQFRFFDLRSLRYFGRNVKTVDMTKDPPEAVIEQDRSRKGRAYASYRDRNGQYEVVHPSDAEYALTFFFLEGPEISGEVFLAGAFSNWSISSDYRMQYIPENEGYVGSALLKEGEYDYQYLVRSESLEENELEGDHFQTENEYEIMVYYYSRELGTDLLLGYFRMRDGLF